MKINEKFQKKALNPAFWACDKIGTIFSLGKDGERKWL